MRIKDYIKLSYTKKDITFFLVVIKHYLEQYKLNAFVDRDCYDLEEARYIASSIENCDRKETIIVKIKGGQIRVGV